MLTIESINVQGMNIYSENAEGKGGEEVKKLPGNLNLNKFEIVVRPTYQPASQPCVWHWAL